MQLWTPPTPPQDDNDIYIDSVICLMYDSAPMPESKLPPVYIRKEHKRLKMDPSGKALHFYNSMVHCVCSDALVSSVLSHVLVLRSRQEEEEGSWGDSDSSSIPL